MSKSTMNIQLNALTIFSVLSFFFIVLFVFNNKDELLGKKPVQVKEQQGPLLVVSPAPPDPIIQYYPSLEKPPIVEQEKAIDKQNQEKVEKKPTLTPEQQAAKNMELQHKMIHDFFLQANKNLTDELKKQQLSKGN